MGESNTFCWRVSRFERCDTDVEIFHAVTPFILMAWHYICHKKRHQQGHSQWINLCKWAVVLLCLIGLCSVWCWVAGWKFWNLSQPQKKKKVVFRPWTARLHQVRSRGFSQRLQGYRPKEASESRERCCLYSGLSAIHFFSTFCSFVHFCIKMHLKTNCDIVCHMTVTVLLRFNTCWMEKKTHYINFNQT